MNDYVERAPLLAKFKQLQDDVFGGPLMVRALEEAPAADVVPAVRGEWVPITTINKKFGVPVIIGFTCSNCRIKQEVPTNYCSFCGAKMKGAER